MAGYVNYLESVVKNKNIGQILLLHCIVDMAREGVRALVLTDASGKDYYRQKFGFVSLGEFLDLPRRTSTHDSDDSSSDDDDDDDDDSDGVSDISDDHDKLKSDTYEEIDGRTVIIPDLYEWLTDPDNVQKFERMTRESVVPVVPSDMAHLLVADANSSHIAQLSNAVDLRYAASVDDTPDADHNARNERIPASSESSRGGDGDGDAASREAREKSALRAEMASMDRLPDFYTLGRAADEIGDDEFVESVICNRAFNMRGGGNAEHTIKAYVYAGRFAVASRLVRVFGWVRQLNIGQGLSGALKHREPYGNWLPEVIAAARRWDVLERYIGFARKQLSREKFSALLRYVADKVLTDDYDVEYLSEAVFDRATHAKEWLGAESALRRLAKHIMVCDIDSHNKYNKYGNISNSGPSKELTPVIMEQMSQGVAQLPGRLARVVRTWAAAMRRET